MRYDRIDRTGPPGTPDVGNPYRRQPLSPSRLLLALALGLVMGLIVLWCGRPAPPVKSVPPREPPESDLYDPLQVPRQDPATPDRSSAGAAPPSRSVGPDVSPSASSRHLPWSLPVVPARARPDPG
jgi:hypothetical protein